MAENTKIEWADHTWNPWIGCSHAHTGCDHCYAEAQAGRHGVVWGPKGTRRKTSEAYWRKPLAWNWITHRCMNCRQMCFHEGQHPKELRSRCCNANAIPARARVFPSLCDPFEDWAPCLVGPNGLDLLRCHQCRMSFEIETRHLRECPLCHHERDYEFMAGARRDFFQLIDATPNLDWLLLTKRPENVRKMWLRLWPGLHRLNRFGSYRKNVWLIYSASDQETLETGLPHLLKCRDLVPVLGVSLEPLVGPVDLSFVAKDRPWHPTNFWIIVGGESGRNARPCRLEWIRSIVQECRGAGVPCFVKQIGANPWMGDGWSDLEYGARDPKGGDPSEWPEDLRVREFPKCHETHSPTAGGPHDAV